MPASASRCPGRIGIKPLPQWRARPIICSRPPSSPATMSPRMMANTANFTMMNALRIAELWSRIPAGNAVLAWARVRSSPTPIAKRCATGRRRNAPTLRGWTVMPWRRRRGGVGCSTGSLVSRRRLSGREMREPQRPRFRFRVRLQSRDLYSHHRARRLVWSKATRHSKVGGVDGVACRRSASRDFRCRVRRPCGSVRQ